MKKNVWGAITSEMELKIPYKFDWLGNFTEGLAAYSDGDRIGFCDVHGAIVIPPKYRVANIFSEGLAPVALENSYGFIDRVGRLVIPERFEDALPFFEGKACVYCNSKRGFIHPDGTWLRKPDLDSAGYYSEGYAAVRQRDTYFYLDHEGKRVGPDFDVCTPFHLGRSLCQMNGSYVIVDRSFKILSSFPDFQWAGLSPTLDIVSFNEGGRYGYAKIDGTIGLQPIYDETTCFYEDRAGVRKGKKWAVFAFDAGNIHQITDFVFDDVSIFKEGFAVVKVGRMHKFLKADGTLAKSEFYIAQLFSAGLAPVCK